MADAFTPDLTSITDLHRAADRCRDQLSIEQVRFVHLLVGRYRGNVSGVCRELGITDKTGWRWRDRDAVKAYAQALVRIEAARLFVSRATVIGEVAAISQSDMAEMMAEISQAAREAGGDAQDANLASLGAENGDAHHGANLSIWASPDGADILARLPRRVSRTIKRVKFDTAKRDVYGTCEETGKRVVVRSDPVAVISEIEMHDKLRSLAMLGDWLGLETGTLADGGDGKAEEWKGLQIVGPQKAEE